MTRFISHKSLPFDGYYLEVLALRRVFSCKIVRWWGKYQKNDRDFGIILYLPKRQNAGWPNRIARKAFLGLEKNLTQQRLLRKYCGGCWNPVRRLETVTWSPSNKNDPNYEETGDPTYALQHNSQDENANMPHLMVDPHPGAKARKPGFDVRSRVPKYPPPIWHSPKGRLWVRRVLLKVRQPFWRDDKYFKRAPKILKGHPLSFWTPGAPLEQLAPL